MNYAFLKRYNPAYDFFLIRYFNENGIIFNETLTFEEVQPRTLLTVWHQEMPPAEKLFLDYVGEWRFHPESRPALIHFLKRTLPEEQFTLKKLLELESMLPAHRGKLVFSKEEIAEDIFNFYKRLVREPLRRDLERGALVRDLVYDYLDFSDDFERLPRSRDADHKKFDAQVRELARERLAWFDALDTNKVSGDIAHLLEDHFGNPQHMKQSQHSLDPKETMFCEHESEIVSLDGSRRTDYASDLLLLRPSHGLALVKEGWENVIFPEYNVFQANTEKERINTTYFTTNS